MTTEKIQLRDTKGPECTGPFCVSILSVTPVYF